MRGGSAKPIIILPGQEKPDDSSRAPRRQFGYKSLFQPPCVRSTVRCVLRHSKRRGSTVVIYGRFDRDRPWHAARSVTSDFRVEALMSSDSVPDDVRELIRRHIDSVTQLETLLFLRAHSSKHWSVASIAGRLYAPEPEIECALAGLCGQGFLAHECDGYRYECSDELRLIVDRLAGTYARHLVPLTNFIHANSRDYRTFLSAP